MENIPSDHIVRLTPRKCSLCNSRAVNNPENSELFKLWPKHKTLHKSSLGHKDQILEECQDFWREDDVIFDQKWSHTDWKISFFKTAYL